MGLLIKDYLEDGLPGIGSSDQITPIYKPFGKGTTRSLGDLGSPWLLTTSLRHGMILHCFYQLEITSWGPENHPFFPVDFSHQQ